MQVVTGQRLRLFMVSMFLIAALLPPARAATEDLGCRIGFDVGSSGIRVGSQSSANTAKVNIDYLKDVWQDNRMDATVDLTVEALKNLPKRANLADYCGAVAGGYSAWRYAVEKGNPAQVSETLKEIFQRSGVFFFVIPQDVEGAYGHLAAQQALGNRLVTPMVLDMGGGSMQFAAEMSSWGTALGSKSWHKRWCQSVKQNEQPDCAANPVGLDALARSREVLTPELTSAKTVLGTRLHVTAVSSPVVKAIHPTLRYLKQQKVIAGEVDEQGFDRVALQAAIHWLSEKDDEGLFHALGRCQDPLVNTLCDPKFASHLLTNMLLVAVFMDELEIQRMEVANADLTNVPGILADKRIIAWSKNYECYLSRLRSQGVEAFRSDPASCP